jgi:16S rRNA (cytosine967-C5)-methyltransferase
MKISPARIAAFEILRKIESERAFSSALLPIYEEKLAPKDRALCHALTLGVLRRQIYLDKTIEFLTSGKKLDAVIKIILRLGLYQLIYLDKVPAHAIINDSVNLVQKAKKTSAKSFVNAVLRRFTREEIELNFIDETEKVSVETSHPRWLIEKWSEQFGFAEAEKLARENNETPKLVFRLTSKSDESTVHTLKKLGLEISESEIVRAAWQVSNSSEILQLYAADGKIYFQDEASQLVAQTVRLKEVESFFDVCAAPGSKITQIQNSRFKIQNLMIAGDFFEHRVKFLRANCCKQNADFIEIVRYDAENALPFAEESFDAVLVDAPCSGTGTIRHNPEIRYFLREDDFSELAGKQLRILGNASKLVKTGGRLIYSTCSLEREENETVAEKFLAENKDFEKITPEIAERFRTTENYARTFPPTDKTDGFFIAVFEKNRLFGKVLDDSSPEKP